MKWMRTVWRWGSLGVSVAAIGGIAFAGKQWAEQHALETVLGHGARTDSLTIHWGYSAGCAENVSIPLAADVETPASSRLSARRMWFTYDLPALLRKRVVLPRIVIEDAHIVSKSVPYAPHSSAAADPTTEIRPLAWIEQLHNQTSELDAEQFVSGTQVAVDAAMLSEQWRANFTDVHNRARRILVEAKDIQQELTAMDNPLRHEGEVIARRERLEALKTELAGLKNSLLKTDKVLREQQSRVREALLTEKRAMHEAGTAFRLPPASELARLALDSWLVDCLKEPTQYSVLLTNLICSPFRFSESARGSDIHHTDPLTAQFAATTAKIAGDISLAGHDALPVHRAPFTATGSFEVFSNAGVPADGEIGEGARWQMSVGRAMNCISLAGESRNARAGIAKVKLESSAPGQMEAVCEVAGCDVTGSGQVRLREWLDERADPAAVSKSIRHDALVCQLLEEALADLESAPQEIDFNFVTRAGATQVMLGEEDTKWLADELARAASAHVAQKYESAVHKLETHVVAELEAMNRAVAISYNEETQHLQQLLQEIKLLQADVMNNLAQRAGTEFARKSAGDTLR